jgi:hypothetical protein
MTGEPRIEIACGWVVASALAGIAMTGAFAGTF